MHTVDSLRRGVLRLAGWAIPIALATSARAEPPSASVRVRFALAEATLETESAWARKTRVLTGGLGVGLGAATVGVGTVLLGRDTTPGGVVVVGQGGLLLLSGLHGLIWRRDPFEELMRDVERTKRHGGASAVSLQALEVRWYELALRERRRRRIEGGIFTALGGVILGAAAVLAAAPGDMDPTLRGPYTRSLLGAGIGAIGVGLAKLFIPSALERSYVSFEHGTHSTSFRLVPLAGGNTISFGAAF